MQLCRCLKQVSDGVFKNTPKTVRHFVRHFSDTCLFTAIKTATCRCLTKCLKVSDRSLNVTVCLMGVSLDPPDQTPRQQTAFLEVNS